MEDSQDEIKSMKVVMFNNKKEDWSVFDLKFIAIADERGYVGILNGSDTVPVKKATLANNDEGKEMLRLKKVNKRGYRDLVLATKEMSLTIVGNAKSNSLPSSDLQQPGKR